MSISLAGNGSLTSSQLEAFPGDLRSFRGESQDSNDTDYFARHQQVAEGRPSVVFSRPQFGHEVPVVLAHALRIDVEKFLARN